jgi:hypothetical protein
MHAPGQVIEVDCDELAAPEPLSHAPAGDYQLMVLLDTDHNAPYKAFTIGDLRSAVQAVTIDPVAGWAQEVRLTERIADAPLTLAPGQELVDFPSPSLSAFWGRPVEMRALVVTPADYAATERRHPVAYVTHGFGGTMSDALGFAGFLQQQEAAGQLPPMIWVMLDQWSAFGTHEFADSVNNGPWGHALTTELIPHLEQRYRMDARPPGRLLTGHSSGGWATLWLQVRYPEVFGGTWPTSPDPVDFRDFSNLDLSTATNFYSRSDGSPAPLIREGGRAVETAEQVARREMVLGDYGGQNVSYEAVFSPRGPDGRPLPLFDRSTGEIDRTVAAYWREHFDISRILTARARELEPVLRRKLHIVVGTADTFFLDQSVRLLEEALMPLGYDAKFTYLEGRHHFNLFEGDLFGRIALQMSDVARPGHSWTPKRPFDPATVLAQ